MLFATVPVGSSSGKLFVDDLTPRTVDEFLIGTARQFGSSCRRALYWRYREGSHFWEDTNNNARMAFNAAGRHPARALHPGSGGRSWRRSAAARRYVIAELDGAFTKYHEATLEAEWRGARRSCAARTPGATTTATSTRTTRRPANDANIFIGSSFIGDGAGRQLWDFRDGDLRGDRPHLLKVYGYVHPAWNATVGAFFVVAQSGQPWETWSYEPYLALTTHTSDIEPLRRAGRLAPHRPALRSST